MANPTKSIHLATHCHASERVNRLRWLGWGIMHKATYLYY